MCCQQGCIKQENTILRGKDTLKNALFFAAILLYFYALATEFEVFALSLEARMLIFVFCYFLVGWNILKDALLGLLHREYFNENSLMSLASLGAFYVGDGAEAVAILLFYRTGEFLENSIVEKSKKQIRSLSALKVENARILRGGQQILIPPKEVSQNDTLIVFAGERILADGIIIQGEGSIDNSALSGESIPQNVRTGDRVFSGGINLSGILHIQATQSYEDSTLNKLLKLIEDGSAQKSESEAFITKFAHYYTPIVTLLAFCVALIPTLYFVSLGGDFLEVLQTWMYRGIIFLVVSCPCALVISIPLTFFASLGNASKEGILIKGSNYLETCNHIGAFVFDKTGTLTKGKLALKQINTLSTISQECALKIAQALESHSNHPIAKAFTETKSQKDSVHFTLDSIRECAGGGILANYHQGEMHKKVALGNARFIKEQTNQTVQESKVAKCEIFLGFDDAIVASFILEDALKDEAKESLLQLKDLELYMLSGDRREVAEEVAREVGITRYFAELLPQDKVAHLKEILKEQHKKGKKVAFVGDGLNDAPALTLSDIAIAMGSAGSDVALDGANIVIMNDDLKKIPRILEIAHKTRRILWQNIVFALGVKVGIMLLGVFGLTNLWIALFGDVGVALLALMNAKRAMR